MQVARPSSKSSSSAQDSLYSTSDKLKACNSPTDQDAENNHRSSGVRNLAIVSSANDLVFYQPGECDFDRDHTQCGNAPPGFCCTSGRPWCGRVACHTCAIENDVYGWREGGCRGLSDDSCREPSAPGTGGQRCCLHLGDVNNCAASWYHGGAQKRDAMPDDTATPTVDPKGAVVGTQNPSNCTVIQPNKMVYTDGKGVQHSIHLPKGTFETASKHYMDGNHDELSKFPAWSESFPFHEDMIVAKDTDMYFQITRLMKTMASSRSLIPHSREE